jgi:pyrrolysine biosynthesis protein PylC
MNIKLQHFCLGIVGGALQGLESAYLAREAGYHVQVIDRDADAPALNLAHEAHILDVQKEPERFKEIVSCVGAILPATEETRTLDFLHRCCQEVGVPFLHDPGAYAISSSKIRSNAFLADCDIPIPKKWPKCNFPLVVKPSGASGSHGVRVVTDQSALDGVLQKLKTSYEEIVIEAYLKGPSLSLEVIAQEGSGFGYLVTELAFDDRLDCKRVYAPSRLPSELNDSLVKIGLEIARQLGLNGLMDVEVITDLERRELAVLEIDARIPSQTPIAVYHAGGINMVDEWVKVHVLGKPLHPIVHQPGCALLEHVAVSDSCLEVIGETHLLPWKSPRVWRNGDFFGATLALTDYREGKRAFKATLVFSGKDWSAVAEERQKCQDHLASALGLKEFLDPTYTDLYPPQG